MSETENEVLSDNAVIEKFRSFFNNYSDSDKNYTYFNQISELIGRDNKTLFISYQDLDEELLSFFFNNRQVEYYLRLLDEAVRQVFCEYNSMEEDSDVVQEVNSKLVIDDKNMLTKMNRISEAHRGKLISFDCIAISKTETKSGMREKSFKCSACGTPYRQKPNKCLVDDCGSRSIVVSIAESRLTDMEVFEMQERQDDLSNTSAVPKQINVKVYGDLTGKFNPGDTLRITGVVKIERSVSDATLNRQSDDDFSSDVYFDRVVDAHNIQLISSSTNLVIQDPSQYLTDADISGILKFRKTHTDSEIIGILVRSFAPHIYGYEEIKEAILYQSVGSIEIQLTEDVKNRKAINIFLVGDPGVTKTRLLKAAARLTINGQMAGGKGVSGVGLTASVRSDQKGVMRLRVGPVVLAHQSLCCIDEYSNISEDDSLYLLECMESGTFTVNKGGINAKLNADAAFLIATNPDSGKYNSFNSLFENIKIPSQLFSRFHITFVMPDKVDRVQDDKIISHILSSYDRPNPMENNNDFLFKYLLYSRTHNTQDIKISPEAIKLFKSFYHEIRTPERASDITANPRQFEGTLKLGYARCRLMLRNTITEDDALAIIKLMSYSYQTAGMIVGESGGMNQTAIYSKPLDKINKNLAFTMVMENLTKEGTEPVDRDKIVMALINDVKMDLAVANQLFDKMLKDNVIYAPTQVKGRYVYVLERH